MRLNTFNIIWTENYIWNSSSRPKLERGSEVIWHQRKNSLCLVKKSTSKCQTKRRVPVEKNSGYYWFFVSKVEELLSIPLREMQEHIRCSFNFIVGTNTVMPTGFFLWRTWGWLSTTWIGKRTDWKELSTWRNFSMQRSEGRTLVWIVETSYVVVVYVYWVRQRSNSSIYRKVRGFFAVGNIPVKKNVSFG